MNEKLAKVHELAEKRTQFLSPDEGEGYAYYVDVDDVIGLLKAKARHLWGGEAFRMF